MKCELGDDKISPLVSLGRDDIDLVYYCGVCRMAIIRILHYAAFDSPSVSLSRSKDEPYLFTPSKKVETF